MYVLGYSSVFIPTRKTKTFDSSFSAFAIVISLLALVKAILPSLDVKSFASILMIVAVGALSLRSRIVRRMKTSFAHSSSALGQDSALTNAFVLSALLLVAGWISLGPYAIALGVVVGIHRVWNTRPSGLIKFAVIGLGFIASLVQTRDSSGQFWLSFDQLFRSALANGVANWGINDHVGATGTRLSYHWLGEATAGVMATLTETTAVTSVTRVTPILGTYLSLRALQYLGRLLGFHHHSTLVVSALTIGLAHQFDIYSFGSLWGTGLFLIGVAVSISLGSEVAESALKTNGRLFLLALSVLVTPLIALTQTTLGIFFVCFNFLLIGGLYWRFRRVSFELVLAVPLQFALLFFLRATLLSSPESRFYQPTVSLGNVLQFLGNDIYVGDNQVFIWTVSIIFLFTLSQMSAGILVWRETETDSRKKMVSVVLLSTVTTSIVLMNLFKIGDDNQQLRFVAPTIVFGTFCGLMALSDASVGSRMVTKSRFRQIALGIFTITLIVGLLGIRYWLNSLGWSTLRNYGIATLIVAVEVFFLLLAVLRQQFTTSNLQRQTLVAMLLVITLFGHSEQIIDQFGLLKSATGKTRSTPFEGNGDTQTCLHYLRDDTPHDAIVASNLFRIPLKTADEKYFLVSAYSQRRTYVDGPNFVANPRPDWLSARVEVSDEFGTAPTQRSYQTLVDAGVGYFVMPTPPASLSAWKPFAEIVFSGKDCQVLKLSRA